MSSELVPEQMILNITTSGRDEDGGSSVLSSESKPGVGGGGAILPPAVKISLKTQSPVSRERAAISIQMSDPESIIEKVLDLLSKRFPVQAFYQALAQQQEVIRGVAGSPTTQQQVVSPTGRTFASKIQSAMYDELVRCSEQEGNAPPISSATNLTLKTWMRNALASLSADELEEVTTSVSPSNSTRLAQVLLNRAQSSPPPLTEAAAAAAGTTQSASLLMTERQSTASIITGLENSAAAKGAAAGAASASGAATAGSQNVVTLAAQPLRTTCSAPQDAGISMERDSKPLIAVRRVSASSGEKSGEPEDAESAGKWETIDDSVLLADRETEHSNGAISHSSKFSIADPHASDHSSADHHHHHYSSVQQQGAEYITTAREPAIAVPTGVPLNTLKQSTTTVQVTSRGGGPATTPLATTTPLTATTPLAATTTTTTTEVRRTETTTSEVRRTEKLALEGSYVQGQSNICGQRVAAAAPQPKGESGDHHSSSSSHHSQQGGGRAASITSSHHSQGGVAAAAGAAAQSVSSHHTGRAASMSSSHHSQGGPAAAVAPAARAAVCSPSSGLDHSIINSAKKAAAQALQRKATITLASKAAQAAAEAAADLRLRTGQRLNIITRPTTQTIELRGDVYPDGTKIYSKTTSAITTTTTTSAVASKPFTPTATTSAPPPPPPLSSFKQTTTTTTTSPTRQILTQNSTTTTTTTRVDNSTKQVVGQQVVGQQQVVVPHHSTEQQVVPHSHHLVANVVREIYPAATTPSGGRGSATTSTTSYTSYHIEAPLISSHYADTRAMWLTMLERALRAEHATIRECCEQRVRAVLRRINVPCRGVGSVDGEAAVRFIHHNPAVCTRVVNSVRYAVSKAIRDLCQELGFVTTPDWLTCPAMELLTAAEEQQAFGSAAPGGAAPGSQAFGAVALASPDLMIGRALTETSAALAIQSFARHLENIATDRPASAELLNVLSYPTAAIRRTPCAAMLSAIESRRRESLQASLNSAIEALDWEEVTAKPLLAFVQACYNREARDVSGESIREITAASLQQPTAA